MMVTSRLYDGILLVQGHNISPRDRQEWNGTLDTMVQYTVHIIIQAANFDSLFVLMVQQWNSWSTNLISSLHDEIIVSSIQPLTMDEYVDALLVTLLVEVGRFIIKNKLCSNASFISLLTMK